MQQLIKKYVKVACKAASFNIPGMKEVKKSKERILEVGHCVLSYEKKIWREVNSLVQRLLNE